MPSSKMHHQDTDDDINSVGKNVDQNAMPKD